MITPQPAQRGGSAKSSTRERAVANGRGQHRPCLLRRPRQRTSAAMPPTCSMPNFFKFRRERAARAGAVTSSTNAHLPIAWNGSASSRAGSSARCCSAARTPAWLGAAASVRRAGWTSMTYTDDLRFMPFRRDARHGQRSPRRAGRLQSVLARTHSSSARSRAATHCPQPERAMRAADSVQGRGGSPCPSADRGIGACRTALGAGFVNPVVDVDRVQASYSSLGDLVRDLRGMAATNVLRQRSRRPLTRAALSRGKRRIRFRRPSMAGPSRPSKSSISRPGRGPADRGMRPR